MYFDDRYLKELAETIIHPQCFDSLALNIKSFIAKLELDRREREES